MGHEADVRVVEHLRVLPGLEAGEPVGGRKNATSPLQKKHPYKKLQKINGL